MEEIKVTHVESAVLSSYKAKNGKTYPILTIKDRQGKEVKAIEIWPCWMSYPMLAQHSKSDEKILSDILRYCEFYEGTYPVAHINYL